MFINSNYLSKLSPTMKENWLVQIYKNNNSSISYTDTPDLRLSLSEAIYDGENYYPAILNKPSISYSLDLKAFTTKTGSVSLNIANFDLDGTTILELLGNEYINGHVNILSQIDDDATAANALQIFSGKISSFGYKANTIVMSIISNRPFQNVSIPNAKTVNATNAQYNNKYIPLIYGEYEPNTNFTNGQDVYACPFLKNNGKDFIYIIPENTSGSDKLEFYDKGMKRFIELTGMTSTGITTVDGAKTLAVPKSMTRQFKMLPDDVTTPTVSTGFALAGGTTLANTFNGNTGNNGTYSHSASFSSVSRGVVFKLVMPQATGKITAITLNISGTYSQDVNSLGSNEGAFFNLSDSLIASGGGTGFGSTSGDVVLVNSIKTNQTNTALPTSTDISSILDSNTLPDELYLSFRFNAEDDGSYNSASVLISNMYVTVTASNDLDNEPIASQEFNAGIDKLYLGRDVVGESFRPHSSIATLSDLNNPVAIHRELLHSILGVTNFADDTDIVNSGFKTVAELRDSTADSVDSLTTTHWKTRLELNEPQELENVMNQLQYEGCFFFEFSPQAQQTAISGVNALRYFTIPDNPTATVDLSQVDITGYELGITDAQSLETHLFINYKKHPAENQYLKQEEYTASTHNTIFGSADVQKQEVSLDYVYDGIDESGTTRNKSWVNFRKSLFGDYKTIVNTTLVNPEKYAMLQVGDFIDFGEITFEELGSPFDSISDTFDSFIAMPTRLFKDAWSGKKFIITNLKRTLGKVQIQTRQVT